MAPGSLLANVFLPERVGIHIDGTGRLDPPGLCSANIHVSMSQLLPLSDSSGHRIWHDARMLSMARAIGAVLLAQCALQSSKSVPAIVILEVPQAPGSKACPVPRRPGRKLSARRAATSSMTR